MGGWAATGIFGFCLVDRSCELWVVAGLVWDQQVEGVDGEDGRGLEVVGGEVG